MACDHIQELMPQYVTRDLSEADSEMVRAHLSNCLACSLWLEEVGDLESVWSKPTHSLPSASFVSSVMEGIGVNEVTPSLQAASLTAKSRQTWAKTTLYHYGIAASCTVLLLQFGVFQGFGTNAQAVDAVFSAKLQGLIAYASQLFS